MKVLFLGFVFLILTISAKAQTHKGVVKHFSGRYVESNHIYSYYALETPEKDRIILPSWMDGKKIAAILDHEVIIEGALVYVACSEMSEACPTGQIQKVRWVQYQNTSLATRRDVFTGLIKRFTGTAIESEERYDYVALLAGQERIEIPYFLDAHKLLKLNPQVTIIGETILQSCTEVGEACGPSKLHSVSMVKLEF